MSTDALPATVKQGPGIVLLTLGAALLVWPFLPRVWHCRVCKHQWRA